MAKMGPMKALSPVNINTEKIMTAIATMCVQHIKERTSNGVDINGKKFAPYSASYKLRRMLASRSYDVQLILSGDMLKSVHVEKVDFFAQTAVATIGVGANPSRWVKLISRAQKVQGPVAFEVDKKGVSKEVKTKNSKGKTTIEGGQSTASEPSERTAANIVGYWLHHGTDDMPARPWMGVTEEARKQIIKRVFELMGPML